MNINYKEIISIERIRKSSRGSVSMIQETESDRARVVYSAAFRRLQRKTQVFPLEENAAVRSRLTHSLEVAHVGRFLTTTILEKLKKETGGLEKFGIDVDCATAMINIVETACLLHDIGNPPFGHFGEAAISNWYGKYLGRNESVKDLLDCSESKDDLSNFDGNPQGFRIITKLSGVDGVTGMNLSLSQLASTVKYPCFPGEVEEKNPLKKKVGIFYSEREAWNKVREGLKLSVGSRYPLAYIMEAADDISYCLSDIEDGIEKGILKHKEFAESLREQLDGQSDALKEVESALEFASGHTIETAVAFRAKLIRFLVDNAADTYVKKQAEIVSGTHLGLVERDSVSSKVLSAIKKTVRKLLYGKRSSHERELVGHAAITGILEKYECLLNQSRECMDELLLDGGKCRRSLEEEMRLLSLVARKHLTCYKINSAGVADSVERQMRVHMIVDFVSGMTDVFALQTYQKLAGIGP
jgi:dGTPase